MRRWAQGRGPGGNSKWPLPMISCEKVRWPVGGNSRPSAQRTGPRREGQESGQRPLGYGLQGRIKESVQLSSTKTPRDTLRRLMGEVRNVTPPAYLLADTARWHLTRRISRSLARCADRGHW